MLSSPDIEDWYNEIHGRYCDVTATVWATGGRPGLLEAAQYDNVAVEALFLSGHLINNESCRPGLFSVPRWGEEPNMGVLVDYKSVHGCNVIDNLNPYDHGPLLECFLKDNMHLDAKARLCAFHRPTYCDPDRSPVFSASTSGDPQQIHAGNTQLSS